MYQLLIIFMFLSTLSLADDIRGIDSDTVSITVVKNESVSALKAQCDNLSNSNQISNLKSKIDEINKQISECNLKLDTAKTAVAPFVNENIN